MITLDLPTTGLLGLRNIVFSPCFTYLGMVLTASALQTRR